MPPEFYSTLADLGFERFFVVADQNQQIKEANSSRRDIQDCLVIDTKDVVELRENYRNRYPVARLARAFHTGDPASPPPDLPQASPGTPVLYTYQPQAMERGGKRYSPARRPGSAPANRRHCAKQPGS